MIDQKEGDVLDRENIGGDPDQGAVTGRKEDAADRGTYVMYTL